MSLTSLATQLPLLMTVIIMNGLFPLEEIVIGRDPTRKELLQVGVGIGGALSVANYLAWCQLEILS